MEHPETNKLISAIMTAQILNNQLFDLRVNNVFKQRDKQLINNALKVLENVETKWYDKLCKTAEEQTFEVYDVYNSFIKQIANVPIFDMQVLMLLYRLYKDHPSKLQDLINSNFDTDYLKEIENESIL
jgi:hypothetical protein